VVIDKGTYERLLKNCNYKSPHEQEETKRARDEDKDRVLREINERKRLIQQYDQERKKNEKLDEIDELAKEEAEYLLKKANELRQEDDDDIKRLNEVCFFFIRILFGKEDDINLIFISNNFLKLILNAKVCAIRDAQLNEKHQIKKDVKVEDRRMDMMMELNRINSIKVQEEIEKKRKQDLME
jgi:hypothetical protein